MDNFLKKIVRGIEDVETPLGKFLLGDELGEGGTAIVRKAQLHGSTGIAREYAVKFLLADINGSASDVYKRFRQAYINLASIQHLGCSIPLVYFGEHEDPADMDNRKIPYLIMSVADGTLDERFTKSDKNGKKHISPSYEEFVSIFNRLGEIIQIIHEHGIIHRDIKPKNIFYLADKLYLADFDISKFHAERNFNEAKTKKGDRLANINFSAPEQFDRTVGETCEASDWFAFSQVMIWLMTGAPIIKGFKKITLDKIDVRYRPFEILFQNLLQEDPTKRLSTFSQIKQYLSGNDSAVKKQKEEEKKEQYRQDVRRRLFEFLRIVDIYTPQFNGYCQADLLTRQDEIRGLLGKLNGMMDHCEFGIVYKGGDIQGVRDFKFLGKGLWRFSGYGIHYELFIDSVVAYQHHNLGASFVVIVGGKTAREYNVKGTIDHEEFLRYKGRSLPPDVGQSARIEGRLVEIDHGKVEHVVRFVEPAVYFLGPLESPNNENYDKFRDICAAFSSVENLRQILVGDSFANHIRRPEWVRMYD